jgi:hypothetical protein
MEAKDLQNTINTLNTTVDSTLDKINKMNQELGVDSN